MHSSFHSPHPSQKPSQGLHSPFQLVMTTSMLVVMLILLSACDLIGFLPSSRNKPTETRRPSVTSSLKTVTSPVRSGTPSRTATPAVSTRVTKAKNILTTNTDFETNLGLLNDVVASLVKSMESLNSAKTTLAVIDKIKSATCVVTNCWTVLISAMNAVAAGSGQALSELDSLLRQALAFKSKLEAIGVLTTLKSTASTFRISSTETNLDKLLGLIPTKLAAMKVLNQEASSLKNLLAELNSDIALIQKGLAAGNQIAQIPGISELISAIEKIRVAANSAYQAVVNQLTRPLSGSVSVLEALQSVK